MNIAELRGQHDAISRTAGLLGRATSNRSTPQSVAALRWQLARHLMAHLALEDRLLYPAMQRASNDQARSIAAGLQTETGTLAETFAHYMSSWSDDRIAREWSTFCGETQTILKTLNMRIERENRTLYPLAEAIRAASPPLARTG